ncbi:MAG: hypothetical protein PUB18_04070 [bacterium]|nr:hypothetical protein [bacterium]
MTLTEKKKNEWEKTLLKLKLMSEGDSIQKHTSGDLWNFTGQTRGNYFFTKEKMIFVSGFGVETFSIAYKDIKEIKKCMIGIFIPTGIKITALDPIKGKEKKYKCSVMKRKSWMEFLSQKSGVTHNE